MAPTASGSTSKLSNPSKGRRPTSASKWIESSFGPGPSTGRSSPTSKKEVTKGKSKHGSAGLDQEGGVKKSAWQHPGWQTQETSTFASTSQVKPPSLSSLPSSSSRILRPASEWAPPRSAIAEGKRPEKEGKPGKRKAAVPLGSQVIVISDDEDRQDGPVGRKDASGAQDDSPKRIKLDTTLPSTLTNASRSVNPFDLDDLPASQGSSAGSSSQRIEASSPHRTPKASVRSRSLTPTPKVKVDVKGKGKAVETKGRGQDASGRRSVGQQPLFRPEELLHLSTYLLRPSSMVYTTCAALALAPACFDDLIGASDRTGLDWYRADGALMFANLDSERRWRLRSECIAIPNDPAPSHEDRKGARGKKGRVEAEPSIGGGVEVLLQGRGWPVRTVKLVGWLVGVTTKVYERGGGGKVDLLLDDGTAVLECTLELNRSSTLSKSLASFLPPAPPSPKKKKKPESPPRVTVVRKDGANAAYRRPASPAPESVKAPISLSEADPALTKLLNLMSAYSSIPIGSTISIIGTPLLHYSNAKMTLKVNRVELERDPMEEARHRGKVQEMRKGKYAGLFRMDQEWPGWKEAITTDGRATPCGDESKAGSVSPRSKIPRLAPAHKLPSHSLTLTALCTYIAAAVRVLSTKSERPLPTNYRNMTERLKDMEPPIDQPRIRFSQLTGHAELRVLAERIAHREDSLEMAGTKTPSSLLTGTRKTSRNDDQALPASQLHGAKLEKKVQRLFERAVQQLVYDGTVVLSVEEATSDDNSPRRHRASSIAYEDAFALPTWRNLGLPILAILAHAEATGLKPQEKCVEVARIIEMLKKTDDRWGALEESTVVEVLATLDSLDEVQSVGGGFWRIC